MFSILTFSIGIFIVLVMIEVKWWKRWSKIVTKKWCLMAMATSWFPALAIILPLRWPIRWCGLCTNTCKLSTPLDGQSEIPKSWAAASQNRPHSTFSAVVAAARQGCFPLFPFVYLCFLCFPLFPFVSLCFPLFTFSAVVAAARQGCFPSNSPRVTRPGRRRWPTFKVKMGVSIWWWLSNQLHTKVQCQWQAIMTEIIICVQIQHLIFIKEGLLASSEAVVFVDV